MMERIVLDTNVLLSLARGVDIISELRKACDFNFQIFVTEGVLKELRNIAERSRGKDGRAARLAISYVSLKLSEGVMKTLKDKEEYVDDELERLSKEGYIVATNDRELKRRLGRKIVLRQEKIFVISE